MKSALVLTLTLALLFLFPKINYADSPITSTPFSEAYLDVKIVQKARAEGVMSLEIAEYLSSPSNPVDIKGAVINALSWKFEGKSNAELYSYYLALLYRQSLKELDIDILNADEIFCLGYLTVMDDYFHPEKALPLLEKAAARKKNSFTVSIVLALTKAQKVMDSDWLGRIGVKCESLWCEVWKLTEEVLRNEELKQDLRPEAKEIIVDYMVLYKYKCKGFTGNCR